jgi:hypothetical protein
VQEVVSDKSHILANIVQALIEGLHMKKAINFLLDAHVKRQIIFAEGCLPPGVAKRQAQKKWVHLTMC